MLKATFVLRLGTLMAVAEAATGSPACRYATVSTPACPQHPQLRRILWSSSREHEPSLAIPLCQRSPRLEGEDSALDRAYEWMRGEEGGGKRL